MKTNIRRYMIGCQVCFNVLRRVRNDILKKNAEIIENNIVSPIFQTILDETALIIKDD